MSLAFFRPTGGFFERAHPVTKLICLVVAFLPPFFGDRPQQVLPYFLLLFALCFPAGAWPNLRRVRNLMILLLVMSVVLWTFFYPGREAPLTVGPFRFHPDSLAYGATVGLRLVSFMLAAVIFLTSTRIEDFTYGLYRLGLPFVVSFALTLAFRLTPLFMETGQAIVTAQKARGLDLSSGGLVTRIRRHVPIIVPILASSLRRADQLAIALESKGFGRAQPRTTLAEYAVTWRDVLLLAATLVLTAFLGLNHYLFRLF